MDQNSPPNVRVAHDLSGSGIVLAAGMYAIWGLVPSYFKLLAAVDPIEVVLQRILWSLMFLLALGVVSGRLGEVSHALRDRKTILMLTGSTLLLSFNWFLNVVAVIENHMLAVSLGYFLTPLVNVALGRFLLKERVTKLANIALLLAIIAVSILGFGALSTLGISVGLALCFGIYGFVRKVAPVDSFAGLTIETGLLAPLALVWLGWMAAHDTISFGQDGKTSLLLVGTGSVLVVPLLMFGHVVRRLPLVVVGLLQYIGPSVTFLVASIVFREPLNGPKLICFALIWMGLAIFSVDLVRQGRRRHASSG